MGLWGIVGKAAFSFTCAVGEAVLTTGGEAIKGGTKIYNDYQKGRKANLAGRIVDTTCSALGAGIVAGVKDMSQSASDIYADYQKEQVEEAKRRAEEKARERKEYERQQGRLEQSRRRFRSNLIEDSSGNTVIKLPTPISNGGLIIAPPGHYASSAKGGARSTIATDSLP